MGNQNARWSEASDVIPIFPTLVWKIELEARLREAISTRLLAALTHLRRDLPPLASGQGRLARKSARSCAPFACWRFTLARISLLATPLDQQKNPR